MEYRILVNSGLLKEVEDLRSNLGEMETLLAIHELIERRGGSFAFAKKAYYPQVREFVQKLREDRQGAREFILQRKFDLELIDHVISSLLKHGVSRVDRRVLGWFRENGWEPNESGIIRVKNEIQFNF